MADVDLGHAAAPDELADFVPAAQDPGSVCHHYWSLAVVSTLSGLLSMIPRAATDVGEPSTRI